jgi:type I restriction enzyme, S subunit
VSGYFNSQSNVSSINSVYNASLSAIIPIWFPKDREQEEIVAVLDAIDEKVGLHKSKRAEFENLSKTILYRLMTREIRISDLDLSVLIQASDLRDDNDLEPAHTEVKAA